MSRVLEVDVDHVDLVAEAPCLEAEGGPADGKARPVAGRRPDGKLVEAEGAVHVEVDAVRVGNGRGGLALWLHGVRLRLFRFDRRHVFRCCEMWESWSVASQRRQVQAQRSRIRKWQTAHFGTSMIQKAKPLCEATRRLLSAVPATLLFNMLDSNGDTTLPLDYRAMASDGVDGLTDDEVDAAAAALDYLAATLGENVIRNAAEGRHAVLGFLIPNRARWTRRALVEFAGRLRLISSCKNAGSLIARMRDPRRCIEADSVLTVASRAAGCGLIVEFDAPTLVDGKTKVPDLRLIRGGASVYVEISELFHSREAKRANHTALSFAAFFGESPNRGVLYAGTFFRAVGPSLGPKFLAVFEAARERALIERMLVEVDVPDMLEFAFAPEERRDSITDWASRRRLWINAFSGPDDGALSPSRLRGKIQKECEQLPPDAPGFVVVFGAEFRFMDRISAMDLAATVMEELEWHPHVAGVTVSDGRWIDPRSSREAIGDVALYSTPIAPGRYCCSFFVSNALCKFPEAVEMFRAVVEGAAP